MTLPGSGWLCTARIAAQALASRTKVRFYKPAAPDSQDSGGVPLAICAVDSEPEIKVAFRKVDQIPYAEFPLKFGRKERCVLYGC